MPASAWCPVTLQKGVVSIPAGHPLYSLLGTGYQSVVEQYLGYASGSGATCTWHTSWQPAAPSAETSEMIRQAYSLIAAAEEQLLGLDPAGAQYQAVSTAIYDLRAVISQAYPSLEEINTAVTRLTQAMMGFLY